MTHPRYFLSQKEVFSHTKKFPVIGRYFLSQEEISSTGRHNLAQDNISQVYEYEHQGPAPQAFLSKIVID